MIDTKAVRALADDMLTCSTWSYNGRAANMLEKCAEEIDALRGQALSSIERKEYFAMKKKAAEYDTLLVENARLNDELHSLTGGAWTTWQQERDTLRELVREAMNKWPMPLAGWFERAEKALGD